MSLNGSEMITGGSIIMPMLIRMDATAMSMMRNGTKIMNPISKARFSSDSMKAGMTVDMGVSMAVAGGLERLMFTNSFRSSSRTCDSMNFFMGTLARSSA